MIDTVRVDAQRPAADPAAKRADQRRTSSSVTSPPPRRTRLPIAAWEAVSTGLDVAALRNNHEVVMLLDPVFGQSSDG